MACEEMVKMKPVIGITTFSDNKMRRLYNSVSHNYVNSVYMAGGIPLLIPIVRGKEDIENYIDMIDGLLLSGGEDVSPLLYGESPIKEVTVISEDRDYEEYELYFKALERNMPVLGICRGIQLMNAASGGTLYQDIYVQCKDVFGHSPMETPVDSLYHTVKIEKDSKLYKVFDREILKVNSFHHQAVKVPGRGFDVTALSPDGIIEGIENKEKGFVVGVQWHPEDLTIKYPQFLKLFSKFTEHAYNFSDKRS